MSSLTIQKTTITSLAPHNGADRLEIANVLGWQLVVQKGLYKVGDSVVYFPPDTVLDPKFSDAIGVTNYLSNGRIKAVKLRGEPSFGLLFPISDDFDVPDEELAEHFGASKYEPPVKFAAADAVASPPWFHKFFDIWNIRNFPTLLEGRNVWITEKIDGTSFRVGYDGNNFFAGSKNYARKEGSTYWMPVPKLQELAKACLSRFGGNTIMIFGEIYGKGIQKLQYGTETHNFAVYDIAGDGVYASPLELAEVCREFGVPSVPFIYAGKYDLAQVIHSSKGKTTIGNGAHIREGVVVRDIDNGSDPKVGRLVGKYVSDDYLVKSADSDVTDS